MGYPYNSVSGIFLLEKSNNNVNTNKKY